MAQKIASKAFKGTYRRRGWQFGLHTRQDLLSLALEAVLGVLMAHNGRRGGHSLNRREAERAAARAAVNAMRRAVDVRKVGTLSLGSVGMAAARQGPRIDEPTDNVKAELAFSGHEWSDQRGIAIGENPTGEPLSDERLASEARYDRLTETQAKLVDGVRRAGSLKRYLHHRGTSAHCARLAADYEAAVRLLGGVG